MRHILRLSAGCVGLVLITTIAAAGDRDKRKNQDKTAKPAPSVAEQVEQWLQVLKNDRKDDRRVKAADELGKLASPDHPEIVSALIDALVRDESSSVRKATVKSLAEIEPATHEVKDALEQAVKQDKSWLVRQAARLAAWRYKPKDEPPTIPAPRTRNTSKPTATGKLAPAPKAKTEPTADPLKTAMPPLPVLPAVPSNDPPTTAPAQLSAPRPGGE